MIDIRPYRADDSGPLLDLVRQLQGFEAQLYERMKPAADIGAWYLDLLERQCREQAGTILVACSGDNRVGYATILTNVVEDGSGDEIPYVYAHVGDLVVAENARRQGIARLLLEACESYARAAGRDELRISVLAANNGAHSLYRACGFADLQIKMRKRLAK
jgi:ribosomal protein S18 acetylase RimI-like enzyme